MKTFWKIALVVAIVLLILGVFQIFSGNEKSILNSILAWIQNFFGLTGSDQFQIA